MTTPEQQLAKIIEAQVKGGYDQWASKDLQKMTFEKAPVVFWVRPIESPLEWMKRAHILEILLDPQGLKAAYGTEIELQKCKWVDSPDFHGMRPLTAKERRRKFTHRKHSFAAVMILYAWLTGGATAAIETAYQLLPA